jgi:hypothetical protein
MEFKNVRSFREFTRGMFSEPDGTPSSSRVLMYIFAGFTLWLLWKIIWHIFGITDTTQLTIWLSNLPLLITALMGLIALPYTINKGAGAMSETFSGIANMMASAKQVQLNANIEGKISDMVKKAQNAAGVVPPPAAPAADIPDPAATGTNGTKG